MIVSHRHRFIFIKTRKTGGTSLELALSTMLGPDDVITRVSDTDETLRRTLGGRGPQHEEIPRPRWGAREWWRRLRGRPNRFRNHDPARRLRRWLTDEVWNDYHKFTIDRNPWDLAISAYHWHHRDEPRPSLAEFIACGPLASYSNWPLYTIDDRVAVDQVIRYEELSGALPQLATRLGLPAVPVLPNAKAGFRTDRRGYRDLLGPEERARIEAVFAREIDAFGWTY